jgi:ribosomal protein S18 acetylase RimI-like enzyme
MAVRIVPTAADSPTARTIIAELDGVLAPHYPEESRHGYDVDKLIAYDVDFFVIHHDGEVAGCGGVQFHGSEYGELKRMYVRPAFRGRGLGRRLVHHLADLAASRGVGLLRLETGVHQEAAIRLYEGMGFTRIPPFGAYRPDPLSIFYEKDVSPRPVGGGI